jgi:hypothetical protein
MPLSRSRMLVGLVVLFARTLSLTVSAVLLARARRSCRVRYSGMPEDLHDVDMMSYRCSCDGGLLRNFFTQQRSSARFLLVNKRGNLFKPQKLERLYKSNTAPAVGGWGKC